MKKEAMMAFWALLILLGGCKAKPASQAMISSGSLGPAINIETASPSELSEYYTNLKRYLGEAEAAKVILNTKEGHTMELTHLNETVDRLHDQIRRVHARLEALPSSP